MSKLSKTFLLPQYLNPIPLNTNISTVLKCLAHITTMNLLKNEPVLAKQVHGGFTRNPMQDNDFKVNAERHLPFKCLGCLFTLRLQRCDWSNVACAWLLYSRLYHKSMARSNLNTYCIAKSWTFIINTMVANSDPLAL